MSLHINVPIASLDTPAAMNKDLLHCLTTMYNIMCTDVTTIEEDHRQPGGSNW